MLNVISGLLCIPLSIILFIYTDKVPATPTDYEQLEEQVYALQQNPDLLLEIDGNINININDKIITIEFENDECKITAKYDKNFEILSLSKKDKSHFWLLALGGWLIVCCFAIYSIGWPLTIVILFLEIAVERIVKWIKRLKSKFKKK